MGRFKGGLKSKGWVNSVVINVINKLITSVITYRYFYNYKYNVKHVCTQYVHCTKLLI